MIVSENYLKYSFDEKGASNMQVQEMVQNTSIIYIEISLLCIHKILTPFFELIAKYWSGSTWNPEGILIKTIYYLIERLSCVLTSIDNITIIRKDHTST